MYIKKVRKKNHGSDVVYEYLHLVENVRTENGPRQRLILNLGNLDVHEDKYKELANCIESFLVGQETLFSNDLKIEKIARDAVSKIFKNRINSNEETNNLPYQNDFRNVDVNSIETSEVRSIGPEYVCHQIWKKLNLNSVLADAGMLSHYIPIIETLVI